MNTKDKQLLKSLERLIEEVRQYCEKCANDIYADLLPLRTCR